ncbi:TRAP transporter large permease [uncultured Albimonas sp.]|mgnify:CR=1 FL=1|uniref:TRAP transporter large permease n=1 Tax=uncultured Albimonas sp. TaxID=1331701 RepID=UPI0030EB5F24|tara:strand:- start:1655 stop:2944 length:1290 start_codon:yes stop_codon:yes gene_type:complete
MTAALVIALLFGLIFLAMPVSFAMFVAGIVGLWWEGGWHVALGVLKTSPYQAAASYTLTTFPMFVLMAEVMGATRITGDLFRAANGWLGHLRGGLAYAAVFGGTMLAAACGSSSAAAATLSSAIYPELRKYGYGEAFSTGALAAVGTLSIMIPPSIALIFYGILTEVSVGKLLIAGVVPGLMTALAYGLVIWRVLRKSDVGVQPRQPMGRRVRASLPALPMIVLLAAMLVMIYSGIATPTEVGALGALFAFAIGFAMMRMDRAAIVGALGRATRSSAMILAIIAFSSVFAVFLSLSGTPQALLQAVQESGLGPLPVLLLVIAVLLVLGIFLDQIAILIITLPLVHPLLTGLGYDEIWLGVLVVKTAEIGLLTPPVGLNLFIVSGSSRVPVATVARGVVPFVAAELVLLVLLVAFPAIATWLPSLSQAGN